MSHPIHGPVWLLLVVMAVSLVAGALFAARAVLEIADAREARMRAAARALVDALPRCDFCSSPATRAWERGAARFCDVHAVEGRENLEPVPEYPRAAPLRALVAMLGGGA